MSGEAAQQVLDTSIDATGLSIVSAQRTATDPRNGAMYNPVVLAAGVPVWFHPLQSGQYVAVFRSHWINATMGTHGPQSYSAHTEAGSCWVKVDPPSGGTVALGAIPTRQPGTLIINGAASRYDFLYTVGTLDGVPIAQHHRVSPAGMLLQGEELLPVINGVSFDKGCYYQGDYLIVLGTDAAGKVYQSRRRWARIGTTDTNHGYTWQYQGAKGWLTDPLTLAPTGLVSTGPVSVAKVRDRLVISVVTTDGSAYTAQAYSTRQTDVHGDWRPLGVPVPLGDATTYLGGGLYWQGQLDVNPAFAAPERSVAQIPYVLSTRVNTAGEQSIDTAWGLWAMSSTV